MMHATIRCPSFILPLALLHLPSHSPRHAPFDSPTMLIRHPPEYPAVGADRAACPPKLRVLRMIGPHCSGRLHGTHICCSALILLGPISGGDVDESPPPSSDRPLPTIFLCDDIKGRDRRLHHSNAASDRPTTTTPLLQFTPVQCSHWTRPSTSPASGPQDVQPIIALPQIRRQGVCGVCVSSKSIIRHRSSTTGCLSPPANLPCLQSVVLYSDAACLLLSHRSHPQNSVLSVAASLDNKNITAA
jgi:hypothetical protein